MKISVKVDVPDTDFCEDDERGNCDFLWTGDAGAYCILFGEKELQWNDIKPCPECFAAREAAKGEK